MKCRFCWTNKAYLREEKGFKAALYSCFGLIPLKCHHCYRKFWTLWFTTWGKTLHPPTIINPMENETRQRSTVSPSRRPTARAAASGVAAPRSE